jgi:hypothetical protein
MNNYYWMFIVCIFFAGAEEFFHKIGIEEITVNSIHQSISVHFLSGFFFALSFFFFLWGRREQRILKKESKHEP